MELKKKVVADEEKLEFRVQRVVRETFEGLTAGKTAKKQSLRLIVFAGKVRKIGNKKGGTKGEKKGKHKKKKVATIWT